MLPRLVMEGRLIGDPNLRYTDQGLAVCDFTIVANDRKRNDASGQWEDVGDPLFVRVTVWRQQAENCAESLNKGDLVVASGKLKMTKFEGRDGMPRQSLEMTADSVAVSLLFRTVKHSTQRGSARQATDDDPWATPPANDEPPF